MVTKILQFLCALIFDFPALCENFWGNSKFKLVRTLPKFHRKGNSKFQNIVVGKNLDRSASRI